MLLIKSVTQRPAHLCSMAIKDVLPDGTVALSDFITVAGRVHRPMTDWGSGNVPYVTASFIHHY